MELDRAYLLRFFQKYLSPGEFKIAQGAFKILAGQHSEADLGNLKELSLQYFNDLHSQEIEAPQEWKAPILKEDAGSEIHWIVHGLASLFIVEGELQIFKDRLSGIISDIIIIYSISEPKDLLVPNENSGGGLNIGFFKTFSDVLAFYMANFHELGHEYLDSIAPKLGKSEQTDILAIHEFMADLTSARTTFRMFPKGYFDDNGPYIRFLGDLGAVPKTPLDRWDSLMGLIETQKAIDQTKEQHRKQEVVNHYLQKKGKEQHVLARAFLAEMNRDNLLRSSKDWDLLWDITVKRVQRMEEAFGSVPVKWETFKDSILEEYKSKRKPDHAMAIEDESKGMLYLLSASQGGKVAAMTGNDAAMTEGGGRKVSLTRDGAMNTLPGEIGHEIRPGRIYLTKGMDQLLYINEGFDQKETVLNSFRAIVPEKEAQQLSGLLLRNGNILIPRSWFGMGGFGAQHILAHLEYQKLWDQMEREGSPEFNELKRGFNEVIDAAKQIPSNQPGVDNFMEVIREKFISVGEELNAATFWADYANGDLGRSETIAYTNALIRNVLVPISNLRMTMRRMDVIISRQRKLALEEAKQDVDAIEQYELDSAMMGVGGKASQDGAMKTSVQPRPLDDQFVINTGENLNKGSGNLNDIYVAMTEDGKRIAVKIPKSHIFPIPDTYDAMLNLDEQKLISLEPYDGAHYYGRVKIMVDGQEKVGLAMEILEGIDILTMLESEKHPFQITDQHIQSLKDFINRLEREGKMVWEPNEGNFMLTPNGKVRPIDMLVKDRENVPQLEISLSRLDSIMQRLEKDAAMKGNFDDIKQKVIEAKKKLENRDFVGARAILDEIAKTDLQDPRSRRAFQDLSAQYVVTLVTLLESKFEQRKLQEALVYAQELHDYPYDMFPTPETSRALGALGLTIEKASGPNINRAYIKANNATDVKGIKAEIEQAYHYLTTDPAMLTPGGIDMNSANLHLVIKRDGHGVPLPLNQQDLAQLSNIEGLDPVILSIKPASQTALFSQVASQP